MDLNLINDQGANPLGAVELMGGKGHRMSAGGSEIDWNLACRLNGIDMENWVPKNFGSNFDLPSTLEPLSPLRGNFSVLNGLAHNNARALGDGGVDQVLVAVGLRDETARSQDVLEVVEAGAAEGVGEAAGDGVALDAVSNIRNPVCRQCGVDALEFRGKSLAVYGGSWRARRIHGVLAYRCAVHGRRGSRSSCSHRGATTVGQPQTTRRD